MGRPALTFEKKIEDGIAELMRPRKDTEPALTEGQRADREERLKVLGLAVKWLAVKAKLTEDEWGGNLNGKGED